MRITKISVTGLFGMFDHEIPLNQESRITIVHGPNGVGKTVLMQLVHAVFNCNYDYAIDDVPFEQIRIDFELGAFMIVNKLVVTSDSGFTYFHGLVFQFNDGIATQPEFVLRRSEDYSEDLTYEIRHISLGTLGILDNWFQRIDTGEFTLWRKDDWSFTSEQLIDMVPKIHDALYGEIPPWFSNIRREVRISLIVVDRKQMLNASGWVDDGGSYEESIERGGLGQVAAIKVVSENIKAIPRGQPVVTDRDRIQAAVANVISHSEDPVVARYIESYIESRAWRENLARHIAETRGHRRGSHDEQQLFEEIIDERFLFKHFKIDVDVGLNFFTEDGQPIQCEHLSSGEQQLLILYYQLLFETEPDTLVMIDEPELSMNVVWQRNFLKDLQRIIELRKFDVLIATHSPQIIHDKWDWMVPLGEKIDSDGAD